MKAVQKQGSTLGATLLITGCCIGAGMLGLPVVSALAGFIPSTVAMILAYFFATTTGLLLVEAALWFDEKVHLISLTQFALGKMGKWIAWIFFLILFYCLFVAYIEGGGQIFTKILSFVFGTTIAREVGIFACVIVVGSIVYTGAACVSYVSRLFLLFLAISYGSLIVLGLPFVEMEPLLHMDWKASFATIPILFICFGYQNLIPTVIYYVKKNVPSIRFAILIGTFIPFLIYSLWDFVILGILPDMDVSKIVHQGDMVTGLLEKASESSSVLFFAAVFSFFAIVTPFMASTLAFVDFFKDGFKKLSFFQNDLIVYGCVLIPPTLFTLLYPNLFLSALGFAGGFIDAVLFGILPVLIVWIGRYQMKMRGPYRVFGGKPLLLAVFFFASAVLLYRLSEMVL
jgi:tyrosine-specific transport protein